MYENGEIVILREPYIIICYNPSTKSSRYIKFYGGEYQYFILPYIPSFIKVAHAQGKQ